MPIHDALPIYGIGIYEHINKFSFANMFNTTLHTNKVFREQVKACLKNTFGTDTSKNIHKTLQEQNTRVLSLVVFMSLGISIQGKCSKC